MGVTIRDIASVAGVSRGTVDRALHGRGRVDPEVRERVLAVAEKLGYTQSAGAKQSIIQRQQLKFGLICPISLIPGFWSDVFKGVEAAEKELAEYGITILQKHMLLYLPHEQIQMIDELVAQGIKGLVIVPLNDDSIRKRLQELIDAGIEVVIINSELDGLRPLFYLGNDYNKSGRIAAGLLNLFSNGAHTNLMIFTGTTYMASHSQRIEGFLQELARLGTDYTSLGTYKITSDPVFAYDTTIRLLGEHPETNVIFTAAGSLVSACHAIRDLGLTGKIKHISFDRTQTTIPCLKDGTLTAVVAQEAYRQGYQPFRVLFDKIANGISPESERVVTSNEIFIGQNCD